MYETVPNIWMKRGASGWSSGAIKPTTTLWVTWRDKMLNVTMQEKKYFQFPCHVTQWLRTNAELYDYISQTRQTSLLYFNPFICFCRFQHFVCIFFHVMWPSYNTRNMKHHFVVDFSASSNLYSFFKLKPIIVHLSAWLLYVWGYKLITFPFIFTRKHLPNEIHIRCVPNLKPLYTLSA